jgi:TPP-dependent pyruvate/acetoin dehydrogenase alpha subunit
MGQSSGSKDGAVVAAPHESPLVPNRKMKRMYEGIVEARLLEDLLQKRARKAKLPETSGQEACRISALIDLEPEDLTSDIAGSIHTAFLRGASLEQIVQHADALASGKKKDIAAAKLDLPGLLPAGDDTTERIQQALGAAFALKQLKLPKMIVLFAFERDLKHAAWQKVFRFAAQEVLPIFFVILPEPIAKHSGKSHESFKLCALATGTGVPGIPVDASDAVALYRVAQESIGRGRIGGGPALMACLHFPAADDKKSHKHAKKAANDPLPMMGQTLLNRQICDQPWLDRVATAFQSRLQKLSKISD